VGRGKKKFGDQEKNMGRHWEGSRIGYIRWELERERNTNLDGRQVTHDAPKKKQTNSTDCRRWDRTRTEGIRWGQRGGGLGCCGMKRVLVGSLGEGKKPAFITKSE